MEAQDESRLTILAIVPVGSLVALVEVVAVVVEGCQVCRRRGAYVHDDW